MFLFIEKLLNPKQNLTEIIEVFLNLLNIKITTKTLSKDLEEHTNYPAILSVSDVLNSYGIKNITAKF
jgi:hypothetical protein